MGNLYDATQNIGESFNLIFARHFDFAGLREHEALSGRHQGNQKN